MEALQQVITELSLHPFLSSKELAEKLQLPLPELIGIYQQIQNSKALQEKILMSSPYPNQLKIMQELLLETEFWENLFQQKKFNKENSETNLSIVKDINNYTKTLCPLDTKNKANDFIFVPKTNRCLFSGIATANNCLKINVSSYKFPLYPLEVEFHLSKKCNRHCRYCWSKEIDYEKQTELSEKQLNQLLEELSQNKVKRITFSGGKEPLLAPLLLTATALAKNKNFYVRLLTNGISLTAEKQKALLQQEVDWIRISLDTIDSKTYTQIYNGSEEELNLTIQNLKDFIDLKKKKNKNHNKGKNKTKIGLGMLVQKENYSQIKEMAEFAKNLGLDFIDIRGLTKDKKKELENNFTDEELKEINRQGKELKTLETENFQINFRQEMFSKEELGSSATCWFPHYKIVLDLFGHVYDCCLTANPGYSKNHLLGEVKTDLNSNLSEIFLGVENRKKSYCSFCGFNELTINKSAEKFWQDQQFGLKLSHQPFFDAEKFIQKTIQENGDYCFTEILQIQSKESLMNILDSLKKFPEEKKLLQLRVKKIISEIYSLLQEPETANYYHALIFQELTAVTENLTAIQLATQRNYPLKIPETLKNLTIIVRAPLRIELGSGAASDLPLISLEKNGAALNLAINLETNTPGEFSPPLEVRVRRINEPVIILNSLDQKKETIITETKELFSFEDKTDPLRLLKAAVVVAGIVPQEENGEHERKEKSLNNILTAFGGGLEIITSNQIPHSSGLGTSGILGAMLLSALFKISGNEQSKDEIIKLAVHLEQVLGVHGGWQDPWGGIEGSVKFITTKLEKKSSCCKKKEFRFDVKKFTPQITQELEKRLVLYHTGLKGNHPDLLKERINLYLSRDSEKFSPLMKAKEITLEMEQALSHGDFDTLGKLMTDYWNTLKKIGSEASNETVEQIYSEVQDLVVGAKMATFSASRGFMLFLAKEGKTKLLKEKLNQIGELNRGEKLNQIESKSIGRVYNFTINHAGREYEHLF